MRVIIIILLAVPSLCSAQYFDKLYFASWNVNQPLSNTDFAGKGSVHGVRLGYRQMINEKFAFGVDAIWSTYNDYTPTQTYYTGTTAVTTDFYNYVNSYGATLTGDYYFFTEKKLMPYVGLGAGVGYNSYKVYYNVFSDGNNAFGVLLRPQAGVWMKFTEHSSKGIHVGVHFDYNSAKGKDLGYNQFMNAGFEIGLVGLDW